jgi:phage shock protein PspC (stress-responsive transcriptional regulator)
MNKTININLGGYPFIADEDAYDYLSNYLRIIKNHFRNSSGYAEITADIESRLAELILVRLKDRSIVTMVEVKSAIEVMGTPADFGAENDGTTNTSSNTGSSYTNTTYSTGKKIFRDGEDRVLGGVCAGLAAYFGWDSVWVRLIFGISFFVFGFGFLFYIILWVIVPKATTSSDRLAMRGEPINFSNIARTVEHEVSNLGSTIRNLGDEYDKKKTDGNYGSYSSEVLAESRAKYEGQKNALGSGLSKGFSLLGQLITALFVFIKGIGRPVLFLAALFAAFILAVLWFGFMTAYIHMYPLSDYVFGAGSGWATLGSVNVFFLISIPLVALGLFIARILFRTKINDYIKAGMGAFWILNLFSAGLVAANVTKEFGESAETRNEVPLNISGDTLMITLPANTGLNDSWVNFNDIKIKGAKDHLMFPIRLNIRKGDNKEFRLIKTISSRGGDDAEAVQLANNISYNINPTSNVLEFEPYFKLPKGSKWRVQQVEFDLKVPEGKYVRFGEHTFKIINDLDVSDEDDMPWDKEGRVLQMTKDGFICPDYIKSNNEEKKFSNADFKKVSVEGPVKVEIIQGNKYSVVVMSNRHGWKKFDVTQSGTTLYVKNDIDEEDGGDTDFRILITMPNLESLVLEKTKQVTVRDFTQRDMTIDARGDFDMKAAIEVENLTIRQEKCRLDLTGKGNNAKIRLDDDANLDASRYETKTVDITLENSAEARINATEKVNQRNDGGDLRVEGGAKMNKEEE